VWRDGTRALVFVPEIADASKVAAIRRWGAEVRQHAVDCVETEIFARAFATEHGQTYISGYNDPRVVAGQGTIGAELERQLDAFDAVFVAMGGGGLIGGVAGYLNAVRPGVTMVGCSPTNSPVMIRSIEAGEILDRIDDSTRVVGIDEVQFFESDVIDLCEGLANMGRIVAVSGLLKDFRDEYFPFRDGKKSMHDLVRCADYMIYLKAICTHQDGDEICGREATRVQRYIDGEVAPYDSPTIVVGGKENYAPRCRQHFAFYSEKVKKVRTLPLFPDAAES